MDLRLIPFAARRAAIWILNGVGVILLLWVTDTYGNDSWSGDYLPAGKVPGGRIIEESQLHSPAGQAPGPSRVRYETFGGQIHELEQYVGHQVAVLLPTSYSGGHFFTQDHVRELVDQLDLLYLQYREILNSEPDGKGLLTVAFVPESCGMGCGLVGGKGIEILSHDLNYENIARELDAGRLETILVHEMVHNFDAFASYLHYLPDHAHAWTDMFEYFAPYRYGRNTLNNRAPDDVFDSPVRSVWKDYVTTESADWERCVRDQACAAEGLSANGLWAMLYYRIESLHGAEALLRSFRFLVEHKRTNPPPPTELEKEGLRILSLAVGAGMNIACYMDALRWPVAPSVRTEMRQRFGDRNPFCSDADGDGFSAVTGDCDDSDPRRHLAAGEIAANGRDDDCDEMIDEMILSEAGTGSGEFERNTATRLPLEVEGRVQHPDDLDGFFFDLDQGERVRVTLCADDEFRGWAVAAQPDGTFLEAPNWYQYQPAAGCSGNTFDYGALRQGGLLVLADETAGHYSLTATRASELPANLSAFLLVRPDSTGGLSLALDDSEGLLAELGTDEVEFWISGAGIQMKRPYAPQLQTGFPATALQALEPGALYQIRLRPIAGGMPLAAFSPGRLFRYEGPGDHLPTIDHTFSGAWFDPRHEGEGFIVEVLEQAQALVYWFTYQADGRQRWLLGSGRVRDNRIVVEQLVDSRGGRFGERFDPRDVVLTPRGELTINFQDCEQAVVNYSVDGNSGHQSLTRLTSVFGHECGGGGSVVSDLSGSWYDPSHDGEGFILEQLDEEHALALWFTYDEAGNQSWMLNTGKVEAGRIVFPQLQRPTGGLFGRSFDPALVERHPWGELVLDLDCSGGTASYTPEDDAYTPGAQQLVPLTRLAGSGCLR